MGPPGEMRVCNLAQRAEIHRTAAGCWPWMDCVKPAYHKYDALFRALSTAGLQPLDFSSSTGDLWFE